LLSSESLAATTGITMEILRDGARAFAGEATLAQLKRTPAVLVSYLTRETTFADGVFLMPGPASSPLGFHRCARVTRFRIEIAGVGRLVNVVAAG